MTTRNNNVVSSLFPETPNAAPAAPASTLKPSTHMKNLKLLKVPDTIGENVHKAVDALTKEQRAYVKAKLDYVEHILTAFPQSADGERTPSGGCPRSEEHTSELQSRQ